MTIHLPLLLILVLGAMSLYLFYASIRHRRAMLENKKKQRMDTLNRRQELLDRYGNKPASAEKNNETSTPVE